MATGFQSMPNLVNTNFSPAPKNEPATVIETVAGETTYVQMVILTGNWRGGGRLLQVDAGEAQKVIAKLKPLRD